MKACPKNVIGYRFLGRETKCDSVNTGNTQDNQKQFEKEI